MASDWRTSLEATAGDSGELTECGSIEGAKTDQVESGTEEHKEIDATLDLSEDEKRRAVNLYTKGIRLPYVARLFNIENPRVIFCWSDWKKRPKIEADKNLERRRQIQKMIARGDSVKSIRAELKLKQQLYRELAGIAIGPSFTYSMYERVKQQMEMLNSMKVVSKNTGVPVYFVKKWMTGKGIPMKDVIEGDEEASAEMKRKAIEKFYETGNALAAASHTGARNPQLIERWVVKYQHAVDEREKCEVRGRT